MKPNSLARKSFPGWVCALLAVAAFFQASGLGYIAGTMSLGGAVVSARPGGHDRSVGDLPRARAEAVLRRNPFDSATGPLAGGDVSSSADVAGEATGAVDPYEEPPCVGVRVSLVAAADDPDWSFASLSRNGASQLRREGDLIGNAEVVHIGWYSTAREPMPRVWLREGSRRCLVAWGADEAVPQTAHLPAKARADAGVPPDVAAKVHAKNDHEFVVEKSAVSDVVNRYAELMAGLSVRDTQDGMRLSGIRPGSLLTLFGMKNGDAVKSINGFDMGNGDQRLAAYKALRHANSFSIDVSRNGRDETLAIGLR